MRDPALIETVFSDHPPTEEQIKKYQAIREKAMDLAATIFARCPSCADRTDAIRKVREAVMTANAAIALDGAV